MSDRKWEPDEHTGISDGEHTIFWVDEDGDVEVEVEVRGPIYSTASIERIFVPASALAYVLRHAGWTVEPPKEAPGV